MSRIAVGRITLIAASLCAFVFYAGSPMFYSYFQFGTLSGRGVPARLMGWWPFRLWGTILEVYQPQEFASVDSAQSVECRLQTGGSVEVTRPPDAATCRYRIREGGGVHGPYVSLRKGSYDVTFDFATGPSCDGGSVEADVTAGGGNITLAAARARIPEAPRLTLSFDIEGRSHVLQQIETRARTVAGCLVLQKVELRRK